MFNLNDYEDVATRIKKVHDNFPMVRFNIRELKVDHDKGYVYCITEIYRDSNDDNPAAVDAAYEFRSDKGVNRDFWVENCITSSYGRCCGLLLGSDKRSTKSDMEKVQRLTAKQIQVENPADPWTTKPTTESTTVPITEMITTAFNTAEEVPQCKHGTMVLKEGVGDNGPWHGYMCAGSRLSNVEKCKAVYYEMKPSGKWGPKAPKAVK